FPAFGKILPSRGVSAMSQTEEEPVRACVYVAPRFIKGAVRQGRIRIMKSNARAVVIGGGVVGVSTLYHLAKKGWSDVVLIERKELTSGSTWHAAGLLPLFNLSYSVGQIH